MHVGAARIGQIDRNRQQVPKGSDVTFVRDEESRENCNDRISHQRPRVIRRPRARERDPSRSGVSGELRELTQNREMVGACGFEPQTPTVSTPSLLNSYSA